MTSISKYIESKYGDLPAGHTTLLSHHLNRMKETGEIVFSKKSYMKHDPYMPPRRGRGRPPKPKDPSVPGTTLQLVRPRGRPPEDTNEPAVAMSPEAATSSGSPRGRPRKMAHPTGGIRSGGSSSSSTTAAAIGTGRLRGRPSKVKAPFKAEMSVEH